MSQSSKNPLHAPGAPRFTLDLQRCPDGVEIVADFSPFPVQKGTTPLSLASPPEPHYVFRSTRREQAHETLDSIENIIALRFVNARSEDDLKAFFFRFGMLISDWPAAVEDVGRRQARMTDAIDRMLGEASGVSRATTLELVRDALAQLSLSPRVHLGHNNGVTVELGVRSLWQFMFLEVVMASACGARLHYCQRCGKGFMTGPLTGRRGQAKFCSDPCRVASFRKKRKSQDEQQGET
jgi:hypothetical protein